MASSQAVRRSPSFESMRAMKRSEKLEMIEFKDHRQKTCISYFCDVPYPGQPPLVPMWSYQIYITADVQLNTPTARRVCDIFADGLLWRHEPYPYDSMCRLDFIFLQGSVTDCIAHYIAELDSERQQGLHRVQSFYDHMLNYDDHDCALIVVDTRSPEADGVEWICFNVPAKDSSVSEHVRRRVNCPEWDGMDSDSNTLEHQLEEWWYESEAVHNSLAAEYIIARKARWEALYEDILAKRRIQEGSGTS